MNFFTYGDTVRLAVLGLGGRGFGQMKTLVDMPDVMITSLCDAYEDRLNQAADYVQEKTGKRPFTTTDSVACMDRPDVDAVVIMTGWQSHLILAIQAMKLGKRVALEVGGGNTVEECWQLVRTSEETGIPVMLLENCCYNETELALQNMIHQGLFGTIVHCAGAYSHDLRGEIGNGDVNRHYRLRPFLYRNAELYPTHELGPIANYLNLNRGNRMLTLTSMSSKACGLHEWFQEHRPDTPFVNMRVNEGDIVTTMIKCSNGETIVLTHDCSLPRFYSRGGVIRGTKGLWMEDGHQIFIENVSPHDETYWDHKAEPDAEYLKKYRHPLWIEYDEFGKRGGHGGMDYLCLRAFVDSVQNQTEPPIDVYDTAAWLSITALSENSIALGSQPVIVPDFTNGRWTLPRPNPARSTFTFE